MIFLGISPAVNFSNDYSPASLDLNILPIVFQCPLVGYNFDFRLLSILDYGIRPLNSSIINLGFEIGLPYHFNSERKFPYISKGFYLSPGYLLKFSVIDKHKLSSIFLELGYNFHIGKRFSIMTGLQYGRKIINASGGDKLILNHYGFNIILGFWLIE